MMIEYELIKTNRKTVSIKIENTGEVIVRAPKQLTNKQIDEVVETKSEWIKKHLIDVKNKYHQKQNFSIDYKSKISVFGEEYGIKIIDENKAVLDVNNKCFYMPKGLSSDYLKKVIIKLLKNTAKINFERKVIYYAKIMGVVPQKVTITNAKKRWGSCSGKNTINFSWRLVMADHDLIDYVIVHELAHIKEHNHSDKFWSIVEQFLPDYETRQQKLKKFGNKFAIENWD